MRATIKLLFSFLLVSASSLNSLIALDTSPFRAEVIAVVDGDTLEVLHQSKPLRIRLYGIDSPEKGQPYGTKAKSELSSLIFAKIVNVEPKDTDHYGRTVAELKLLDGTNVNHEMLKSGYAWWFEKYAPSDLTLKRLENEARAERRGIWADQNPLAPWNFRSNKVRN